MLYKLWQQKEKAADIISAKIFLIGFNNLLKKMEVTFEIY